MLDRWHASRPDAVDRVIAQWDTVRPDLDSSPVGVIGRLSGSASSIVGLGENFATHSGSRTGCTT